MDLAGREALPLVRDYLGMKRASAKGWWAQMVDLLGYEQVVNAITLARCRARENLEVAA
jgi:hypothetical protein